jgi:hypothetical protein
MSEIPAPDNRFVWYAGYGSNLSHARFECYINGGTPDGSTTPCSGCRDRSAPRDDRHVTLPHELYFADHSQRWGGSVAFIKPAAATALTYARMYLITYGQFNDVVQQENGRRVPGESIVPAYEQLGQADEWQIAGVRLYGRLMKTGMEGNYPVLTFSATRNDFAIGAPSEAYIKVIVAGLEETYPCLRKSEILQYLATAEGIRDRVKGDVLARWILGARTPST